MRVSAEEHNVLEGMYTCNTSESYGGAEPEITWKQRVQILYQILCSTESQCKSNRRGEMWSRLDALKTRRAEPFIPFEFCRGDFEEFLLIESYNSLAMRVHEMLPKSLWPQW